MEKLLWLDMEMTGLEVEKEVVIEVAMIATDLKFEAIDQYHAIIKQPQHLIDGMDDWNKKHHGDSGLIDKIPSGLEPNLVENEMLEFLDKHFLNEKVILAGNSIGQDRLFIDRYFKRFSERLHYRMLDVTSWKIIFNNIYNLQYKKKTAHRALDDILESIDELKFYLSHIQV